jgi:hypothetical protein
MSLRPDEVMEVSAAAERQALSRSTYAAEIVLGVTRGDPAFWSPVREVLSRLIAATEEVTAMAVALMDRPGASPDLTERCRTAVARLDEAADLAVRRLS